MAHRTIAQARGGRALESTIGQGHVRIPNTQRFRICQRSLRSLNVRKQFFISHQVPDGLSLRLIDRNHSQQAKAALKLKDQIVTRSELWHEINLSVTLVNA